ncbi:hypothetical protein Leryth_012960 [Lithospermum erythrorhizon]|nr:hypothetical protein Leryth_012960 [Lithospermum erythrorhizon]
MSRMANFFALGDGRETTNNDQDHHQNHNNHITESWFSLFRNEEIQPYKGLELWQHQQSTTHHHQQQQQHPQLEDYSLLRPGFFMVRQGSSSNNNGGGISCQDCGNQAKKDCEHMRCRTCCKSRGFECQTHVKSTWVPAAERRKRQLAADSSNGSLQGKSSSHEHMQQEEAHQLYRGTRLEVRNNFPPEVNSKASFRCIRVGSINDAQQEYAYQYSIAKLSKLRGATN